MPGSKPAEVRRAPQSRRLSALILCGSSPARFTRRWLAHERTCPGAASSGQPAESTAYYDVEKCHTHQKIPEMQAE